jgi:hypothetical protein
MGRVETRGICVCIMIYSVYVCEALDCVYICRVCVYNNWTDAAPYSRVYKYIDSGEYSGPNIKII